MNKVIFIGLILMASFFYEAVDFTSLIIEHSNAMLV
jgi:hypothetical protein